MAFVGNASLKVLLGNSKNKVIDPYNPENIKNGAYELTLGEQVFLTGDDKPSVKSLLQGGQIRIEPGQFALLLTEEKVTIPKNKMAFISIKAGIKFKGLINVSGFHVDPGFTGKLLFSVYNAGPSNIILSRGTRYFPIWFAELDEDQTYKGTHGNLTRIPDEPVSALSQGELSSPNVLSKRIDELKGLKTKIEWVALALLTLLIGLTVKIWTDANKLKEAAELGYNHKTEEILTDSVYHDLKENQHELAGKVDSLYRIITTLHSPNKKKKGERKND